MKQLYLIGIIVAVLLLILLALNKLGQGLGESAGDVPLAETTTSEAAEEAVGEAQQAAEDIERDITNPNEEPMEESAAAQGNTTVVMKTNKGDITIELFTSDMPVTAGNFLKLAQSDYYDGIKFHRIIDGFMIQGGDPFTKDDSKAASWGTGGPGYAIQDEFGPSYSNDRGTLSMANAGPNTGGSQFFINTANNTFLNGKHPVFGKVVAGMDVVDAISATPTGARDVPTTPVVIEDIVVQ